MLFKNIFYILQPVYYRHNVNRDWYFSLQYMCIDHRKGSNMQRPQTMLNTKRKPRQKLLMMTRRWPGSHVRRNVLISRNDTRSARKGRTTKNRSKISLKNLRPRWAGAFKHFESYKRQKYLSDV